MNEFLRHSEVPPANYPYPWEAGQSECLAYRTVLPTLDCLAEFWRVNRHRYPYAATCDSNQSIFMRQYEWFFAPSAELLVEAVLRWESRDMRVAKVPTSFVPRIFLSGKSAGDAPPPRELNIDEHWEILNPPCGMTSMELTTSHSPALPLSLTPAEATRRAKQAIFRNWNREFESDVQFFDTAQVDKYVSYWLDERRNGRDYYGSETEPMTDSKPTLKEMLASFDKSKHGVK
jgi:hypothetical protein